MIKDIYWDLFCKSGDIEQYLKYRNLSNANADIKGKNNGNHKSESDSN